MMTVDKEKTIETILYALKITDRAQVQTLKGALVCLPIEKLWETKERVTDIAHRRRYPGSQPAGPRPFPGTSGGAK